MSAPRLMELSLLFDRLDQADGAATDLDLPLVGDRWLDEADGATTDLDSALVCNSFHFHAPLC